jgi:CHASE3 domain sensor protein
MKLKDLNIGTQLKVGLGVILLFVVALGGVAFRQTNAIWRETQSMYEHPLQVRRAIGALDSDILAMRLEFRNLFLAENDQDRQAALQASAVRQADAERQFQILFDRYLGPRTDIEDTHDAFVRWVAVREGNRNLAQTGKTAAALDRVRDTGDSGREWADLLAHIKSLDDFARNRGDQLFQSATAEFATLNYQLLAIVAFILLLSLIIGWLLLQGVRSPLAELTRATEQFRQGN